MVRLIEVRAVLLTAVELDASLALFLRCPRMFKVAGSPARFRSISRTPHYSSVASCARTGSPWFAASGGPSSIE